MPHTTTSPPPAVRLSPRVCGLPGPAQQPGDGDPLPSPDPAGGGRPPLDPQANSAFPGTPTKAPLEPPDQLPTVLFKELAVDGDSRATGRIRLHQLKADSHSRALDICLGVGPPRQIGHVGVSS